MLKFRASRVVSTHKKHTEKVNNYERVRRHREKKDSESPNYIDDADSHRMPKCSFNRAFKRADKNLPKCPKMRREIVKRLASKYIPSLMDESKMKSRRVAKVAAQELKHKIEVFYLKSDISYDAPGKNDTVIILSDTGRVKAQKKYLMYSLRETYQFFIAQESVVHISFSTFYDHKPPNVLLRHKTPPSLCLCETHENVNLLLDVIPRMPKTTTDLVSKLVCNTENEECMFQSDCEKCFNLKLFDELIKNELEESESQLSSIVEYEQWGKADNDHLKKKTLKDTLKNIIKLLRDQLKYFLFHVFIKRNQVKVWNERISNPGPSRLMVQMDFSENFVHVTQDAIQKAFYNQKTSTIFTTILYFMEGSQLKKESYCIVSDFKGYLGSKGHDKFAVSHFTSVLIKDFQSRHPLIDLQNVEFLSDGTAQHFKQKFSLCQVLTQNFPHLNVEWHFSPTSHGKGPVDGIGGTLKRRVTEHLLGIRGKVDSTEHFAELATSVCPNINIRYLSSEKTIEFIDDCKLMESWNNPTQIITVPRTHNQHYFKGIGPYRISYNIYTGCPDNKTHVFRKQVDQRTASGTSNLSNNDVVTSSVVPLAINSNNWYIVVVEDARYVVQLIKEIDTSKFKANYYKAIPSTANQKFKKYYCYNNIVEINQIRKKLEQPKIFRGGNIMFPVGHLEGIILE